MGGPNRQATLLLLPLAGFLLGPGEDPPPPKAPPFDPAAARKLAETKLDEARSKESRERYRIVWPEGEPKPPETGAEVVLIGGYISNYIVVLRWTGTAVEERHLSMSRSWFYNKGGESFSTGSVTFPAEEVATRWAAAYLNAGARAERKGPPPDPLKGGGTSIGASHAPEEWIRIRTPERNTPLPLGNGRGYTSDSEGIRPFDDTRSELLFNMLHVLFQLAVQREAATPMPQRATIESWRPFLRTEMARFLESGAPKAGDESLLLVEVCLRALSMAGDATDLELVSRLDARLSKGDLQDVGVSSCREEARWTAIRLRLRWEWHPTLAVSIIRKNPRKLHAQNDLARWTRDLFREKDPKAYREMLVEDIRNGMKDRELLLETMPEVARWLPTEARALLDPLQQGTDSEVLAAVKKALETLPPPK